jgi:ubiquinone/menaquinone biosynthesis C-methylase UbiE
MKRIVVNEMIDTGEGTPMEIAASLTDMQSLNRLFGGETTSLAMMRRVAARTGDNCLRLLETGAGFGKVPLAVRTVLRSSGIRVRVTLLDRVERHLGRRAPAVVGDALALPFRDGSFDVVSCCLFAHHLEPEEILAYANEALRVARSAVIINDLVRHPLHFAMAYVAQPFYRSRLTRHDAPASVRRAYTVGEMHAMLSGSRAAHVEVKRHYLYRMGAIAWKH